MSSRRTPEPTAHVRSAFASKPIAAYVAGHVSPPDALQRALRAETAERTSWAARMQIGDDQAVLMGSWRGRSARAARSRSARSPATRRSRWRWRAAWARRAVSCAAT
jgi:hypothetical protein